MNLNRLLNISITVVTGFVIALVGTTLTWYQVTQAELNNTALAASNVVRANERLLDEARSAAALASPLLLHPCTPQIRTELGRLAIGIEHIRVINLFSLNHLICSSWDGAIAVKEEVPAGAGYTLSLLNDDYISPGVPVMVLRSRFAEGTVTTSMTTHWSAVALRLLSTHRPLTLHVGDTLLTGDNRLHPTTESKGKALHAVSSERYPLSVEYDARRYIPITLFLREGALSLLLSFLLGTAVATGLWLRAFRSKPPYEQLAVALKRGEIVPWYQPIIDAQTGIIIGVEILARQLKPDGSVIPPDHFIPVAESSDLLIPLTRALMMQAARELPEILKQIDQRWHVGLNVTHAHMLETGFITECLLFVDAFAPGTVMLTIELTEREPFDSSKEMRTKLKRMHDNGITVALDDFGTGYANLDYIAEIQVDIIKIDRTFVRRIGEGESGERLLNSVIEMGNALQLRMVAEGVETHEQVKWLTSHGVSWLQGYLYSPPVNLQSLITFVERWERENVN
ncbi:EAL domain-containing protein [Pantoea agglomerans]|uniref:EAL domain-containing protein n=1 Tax=Enterobacter agglomerans TaxID=549 RepID=UPI0013D04EF2|nr:EAL domain-containing protein [Pantoea agglomerans]NEG59690.1 EAL domain-containing protein [Pantoea agglomerans]